MANYKLQGITALAVTPHATNKLINPNADGNESRDSGPALFVGVGGDLTVDMLGGQTDVVFKNVANGTFLPIQVLRVKPATTATDIVAVW